MSFSLTYTLVVFISLCHISHGVKSTSAIITEIKSRSDYRLPPNDLTGVPVLVNVTMFVRNLHAIDEINMEFGLDTYIRKTWNDPRLAFTDGPETVHFGYELAKSFIWMPDLYFSASTDITESFKRNAGVRIKPNGDILVSARIKLKQNCIMDLHSFPLDKQTCNIWVSTYMSTADDVKLQWYPPRRNSTRPNGVKVRSTGHPPGFVLSDYRTKYESLTYTVASFDRLILTFYLDRIRSHYIVLTYIPSFLLVLISCLLFWLPLSAVTERFLFGALLILALSQVLTHSQDQAPQVGYLKAIDIWVVSCYTFICVALTEVVLLYIVSKRLTGAKDDQIELVKNDQLSKTNEDVSTRGLRGFLHGSALEKLDLVLKILYPSAFLLFNIVYWATFA